MTMRQSDNQRAVGDDEPLMIAWKAWKQTDDYANVLSWAGKRCEGDLWAAFSLGFDASLIKEGAESATPSVVADDGLVERVWAAILETAQRFDWTNIGQFEAEEFARAALAASDRDVLVGRIAEWRNRCEYLLACIDVSNEAGAPVDESDPEDVAAIDEIRAALIPLAEELKQPD